MDSFEQELLQDAEDDARTVEFIKNYLPQDVKEKIYGRGIILYSGRHRRILCKQRHFGRSSG